MRRRIRRRPRASVAPLLGCLALPLVMLLGLLVVFQARILTWLNMPIFAIYVTLWAALCLLEIVIVPGIARDRGRDPGIWFIVTVIWICFDSVLAFIAGMFGLLAFGSFLAARDGQAEPGTVVFGLVAVLVAAVLTYLPLIALLVSPPASHGRRPRMA